jgi:hypothetical protein
MVMLCMTAVLPCLHAQLVVADAAVSTLLAKMGADQLIYYAQSLYQMVDSAQNTYNQFQNMLRAEERALQNLKGIQDVKSWDDFMKWQNRQLYLEKEAENRFLNMGVKVGGKNYTLKNIEDIPEGFKDTYVDYWKDDFSEAQRQEMWTKLGLAPSNYVYVKSWENREKALAQNLLTKKDVLNDDNKKWYERLNEIKNTLVDDKTKPEEDKLQEKSLLQYLLEVMMDTNRVTRDMAYDAAEKNEYELTKDKMNNTPVNPPMLSDSYNTDPFAELSEYVKE